MFFGRKKDDEKEGMGVLSCCGKKLRWRFLEESRVLEATCGECGTRYLMGHDDALDDTREWAM